MAVAAAGDVSVEPTIHRDGEVPGGFSEAAAPAALLVLRSPIVLGALPTRSVLPALHLARLRSDPWLMAVGVLLLIGGFVLFAGVLVGIGVIMPTAKDAG